ncbi:MAG: hypothetical protein F6K17_22300, partial [Okeania sp. SIO3C4]|nr:hypothetical protein [Okeania sp. SIO3C4]
KRACFQLFILLAFTAPANALDRKLTAPNGSADDWFGVSVALDDNTALIGSWLDDDNGTNSGSAYLFDTTTGSLLHKFTAPDGSAFDKFGWSVALNDNIALIGAHDDDNTGVNDGSAYLFDTTTGSLLHKFTAPDASAFDFFGYSVALGDNTALIGSYLDDDNGTNSGSAYLFDTTTGNLLQKFTAPDGSASDQFGISVALMGDTALIGSHYDGDNGPLSGSAYLFDTTTGSLLHKFTAPDGSANDRFGRSVALSNNAALIGSFWDDDNGTDSGSAYLFDTTTGNLLQKFTAPDGSAEDSFGWSVALSDNTALIGSHQDDDSGQSSGSAYLFDTTTGSLLQKFTAPDGSANDTFGFSVALSDNTALIGSHRDDDKGESSGSAYLFATNAKSTPEPSSLLGIVGTFAIAALSRKKQQKK